MKVNFLRRLLSSFRSKPDPKFIAQQLRKPTGPFAEKIAAKMDQVNAPLFDLTLDTMQLTDNESVLEIGFGSGTFLNKLYEQANQVRVSGIDHSEEMARKAKTTNQSIASNLKVANSNRLPFSDDSFDKAFCNMVVYFWEQPDAHLKEVQRVLKPGGRFYTGIRTKESMLQFPFVQHGFVLFDEQQWKSVLHDNGFKVIRVERQSDPKLELQEGSIQMESLCVVAENPSV